MDFVSWVLVWFFGGVFGGWFFCCSLAGLCLLGFFKRIKPGKVCDMQIFLEGKCSSLFCGIGGLVSILEPLALLDSK